MNGVCFGDTERYLEMKFTLASDSSNTDTHTHTDSMNMKINL